MNPFEPDGDPVKAGAPGKIILSGEHAVVYGAPVLAVAVTLRAQCKVRLVPEPVIRLVAQDTGAVASCALTELQPLRQRLDKAWTAWMAQRIAVSALLPRPGDLYFYALALLRERAAGSALDYCGAEITLDSRIPMGSGMGSSAATLAAVLAAAAGACQLTLSRQELYTLTCQAERLQHGCNSSIDPMVTVNGGMVRMGASYREVSTPPPVSNWYLVHSGQPEVSTGQCVAEVRRRFGLSAIWNEFHRIIVGLERAFLCGDTAALKASIKHNHQLLVDIGVVPPTVQSFIKELRSRYNAVGKISGAGAVQGEKAGFLLVHSEHAIADLCRQYGFSFTALRCDLQGVRFLPTSSSARQLAPTCA